MFLTPEYEYSYPKNQICFNEKFRKPVFCAPSSNFHFSPINPRNLGTSKLIYVSPENYKIADIGEKNKKYKWKMRNKKRSLEAKNRLREIFVEGKLMVLIRTLICRGQKNQILSKKTVNKCQKHFLKKNPIWQIDQKS